MGGGHAPLVFALVRLHLAHNDLKQGGFGHGICAHKGHLLSGMDHKADVVQHLAVADGLGQVVHSQQVVAALPIRLKVHKGEPAGGHGHVDHLQSVQLLFTAGGLLALGRVGREAGNEGLEFLDLLLVLLVLISSLALAHLGVLVPKVVVAYIHLNFAKVHIADMGADLI